ncbi:MAG: exodeoxyribonuclease I [Pseudomarimonas sp.]
MTETFLWYDLETYGRDPRRTRIAQFAAIRTTPDLEVIGEPYSFYVQPALDLLPSPTACLITGLSPLDLRQRGILEAHAMQRIAAAFAQAGTCGVGWNSLRFDDEFLRFGFYRNFIDPYRREFDQGNSRWDLMDYARLAYAMRPAGIEWPRREDGAPSFRLEHLAAVNGVIHAAAHDALSDVQATLGLARRFKQAQPKLWSYHLGFRDKTRARELLDPVQHRPVLHTSGRFPAERGCAAIVLPLIEHPSNRNQIICCDLQESPDAWCSLTVDELQDRLFAPRDSLPEGETRVPLKAVHINRCPALIDLQHVSEGELLRLGIDREACLKHANQLRIEPGFLERCRRLFSHPRGNVVMHGRNDVDQALYDNFIDRRDIRTHAAIRLSDPNDLHTFAGQLKDARGDELLFRYRARNWPETLNDDEQKRWADYCHARLSMESGLSEVTFETYAAELASISPQLQSENSELIAQMELWRRHLEFKTHASGQVVI